MENRKEKKKRLMNAYPPGTRIELIHMADDCDPIPDGMTGTVDYIDDWPQIHMKWDNRRSLALDPDIDSFRVIPAAKANTNNIGPQSLIIEGLSCSHKRRLFKLIANSVPCLQAPLRIVVNEEIARKHYHVLWYGGLVTSLYYKDWRFELHALGDVYADLYENGRHIHYVKDKANAGSFRKEMQAYFKSDDSMLAALHCTHTKYQLTLDHNNWWECFVIDPEGGFHDLMWALDSDDIFEAIWEIIDGMEETIEDITKPDWRAKS